MIEINIGIYEYTLKIHGNEIKINLIGCKMYFTINTSFHDMYSWDFWKIKMLLGE